MHCWARYLFVVMVIALGTLSMVGACGQKGPLYLPQPGDPQAPTKGTKQSTDVPTVPTTPAAAGPASRSPGLLAWPAQRPITCTVGCTGGSE